MRALAERAYEPLEHGRRRAQQPALGHERRVREDARAEAVHTAGRVALDEAVVGERAQRARRLALVDPEPAGDVDDAEPAVVVREHSSARSPRRRLPAPSPALGVTCIRFSCRNGTFAG